MRELVPGVPDTPNNRFAFGLVAAMEADNHWLAGHSLVVADLSRRIASELGMSAGEQDVVFAAGMLHDIGKVRLPISIIESGGPLTGDELRLFEKHPEWGEEQWQSLIRELPNAPFDNTPEWDEARRLKLAAADDGPILATIRNHHERYDGTGYPDRLLGDSIPLGARIVAVADAYAHLESPGVGARDPFAPETAAAISAEAAAAFDPDVVEAGGRIWGS